MKTYRILIINPGSTSTKLSIYENKTCIVTEDTFHDSSVLLQYPTINDQLDFRMEVLYSFLEKHGIGFDDLDAVFARGGSCYSIPGGVYRIDERIVQDTHDVKGGLYHASLLGVQMAWAMRDKFSGPMLTMEPTVLDELCDLARMTGVRGVYRKANSHALNLHAAARTHAKRLGRRYEDCRLIVCHIDGGISIAAHENGRQIDCNDAGGGEGPFSPTRMGTMSVTDVIRDLAGYTREEIKSLCSQSGGLTSHFGTSNSDVIHAMVERGDTRAVRVWQAMIYQICKAIGSMACVLEGRIDGIVLTGGLLRFADVTEGIEKRCGWIAPITSYPGEFEQDAMASGAMRVLTGEEEPKIYPGHPVWTGFPDDVVQTDGE